MQTLLSLEQSNQVTNPGTALINIKSSSGDISGFSYYRSEIFLPTRSSHFGRKKIWN